MKNLTRKQAEAIYAMWEARAERLERYCENVSVDTIQDWYRQSRSERLAEEMRERAGALYARINPAFIEGWEIVD